MHYMQWCILLYAICIWVSEKNHILFCIFCPSACPLGHLSIWFSESLTRSQCYRTLNVVHFKKRNISCTFSQKWPKMATLDHFSHFDKASTLYEFEVLVVQIIKCGNQSFGLNLKAADWPSCSTVPTIKMQFSVDPIT